MKSYIGLGTVAGVILCGIPMWSYAADPPKTGENTVLGEVLKIEGDKTAGEFYTVKDAAGSEVRLQVNKETKLDCGPRTASATSPGIKADAGKTEMAKSAEMTPPSATAAPTATAGPSGGGWSKDPIPVWQGAGSSPAAGSAPDAGMSAGKTATETKPPDAGMSAAKGPTETKPAASTETKPPDAGMSAAKGATETKPAASTETKPGAAAPSEPQVEAKKQQPKPAELGKRLDDVAAGASPTPSADAGICSFKTGDKVEVQKTADNRATSIRIVKDLK